MSQKRLQTENSRDSRDFSRIESIFLKRDALKRISQMDDQKAKPEKDEKDPEGEPERKKGKIEEKGKNDEMSDDLNLKLPKKKKKKRTLKSVIKKIYKEDKEGSKVGYSLFSFFAFFHEERGWKVTNGVHLG